MPFALIFPPFWDYFCPGWVFFRSKAGPGQTLRVLLRANIVLCLNCTPSTRWPTLRLFTRLNILSSADPIINQWGNAPLMSEPDEHNIQKKMTYTNHAFKKCLKLQGVKVWLGCMTLLPSLVNAVTTPTPFSIHKHHSDNWIEISMYSMQLI